MYKTRILILGAGVMQQPALRWAVDQGWKVFVADGNPDAPGVHLAHEFVPVDLTDVEGMIAAARSIKEREGLDGVFTAGTDFSYTVARVAEALGLPGVSPGAARAASDKAVMRRVFRDFRVPSPPFFILQEGDSAELPPKTLNFPLVVKPVDNMGARGIRRIDTHEEYLDAVASARHFSRSGTVIVEEFVPGEEYSIDALVIGGQVYFSGIADRRICFSPYFVEMGHTIPTMADAGKLDLIKKTFTEAVKALGIREGAAKGDVKWDGSRAVIGEVAARLSGGYMSGWTYPFSSGVELTGAALRQAVGKNPGDLRPTLRKVSAERAFISIPGTVRALEYVEEARKIPGVRECFVRVRPGDFVDFPTNNVEKCGNFIAVAPEREAAVHAAETACRRVFVRLRPGDPTTCRFLFMNEHSSVPHAYRLENPANIEALGAMEEYRYIGGSSPGNSASERPARPAVTPLPALQREEARDWHGIPILEAFYRILDLCNLGLTEDRRDADIIIEKLFWDAFLRGGIQAGVWVVETVLSGKLERVRECR